MQREIKFRAWDLKQKAFINGFNMIGFSTGQGAPNKKLQRFSDYWDLDNIKLMQYTGLKDKNGKEIYEGDILKERTFKYPLVVTWSKEECGFMAVSTKTEQEYSVNSWAFEIIGNICENTELITQLSNES